MRTHGSLSFKPDLGQWVMDDVPPNVKIRLKQFFQRLPKASAGPFFFPDDLTHASDLEWFMQRYPMRITDDDLNRLKNGRFRFDEMNREIERIMLPTYQPPSYVGLRDGCEVRPYQAQAVELLKRSNGLALCDEVGLGKAQPLDAQVLTPKGFVRMGDLRVGDQVIAVDGSTCNVTGVHPRGERDSFRIGFSDGAATECCDEHLWTVMFRQDTISRIGTVTPRREKTVTTRELMGDLILGSARPRHKWQVPMPAPADFDCGGERPLDPYLLGVMLGDGGTTGQVPRFTTADVEIVEEVRAALPAGARINSVGRYAYSITDDAANNHRPNVLRVAMAKLGLWGKLSLEKFVPKSYLEAPADVRLAVLQGLMDTDGYAMPLANSATAQFFSSSEQLARDVLWLTRSLGGTGKLTTKFFKGRTRYTITVKLPQPLNPFRLDRKSARWGEGHQKYAPRRFITSIEPVGLKAMQCITIDHPSRLYITDDFVVTHNSFVTAAAMLDEENLPGIVVCQTHLQTQWANIFRNFTTLWPYTPKGTRPYDLPPANVYIFRYSQLLGWADYFELIKPKLVAYDEIQELRSGIGTESNPVQKGLAARRLSRLCHRRLGLSATPIYNYGDEIYNIMMFLAESALGNREEFLREWCAGGKSIEDKEALGAYLRDEHVLLRRTKKDVGKEMPPINRVVKTIEYDHKAVEDAEQLAQQLALRATTGDFHDRGQAIRELDVMMRKITGVAKAKSVANFVRIIVEAGEPVVLFGWHRDVYDIWREELKDLNPVMYTGSENANQKEASKQAFMDGHSDIIILSLRSGAGLNGLQLRSSTAVFGELDWSPGVHHQCIGRLDREGQKDPVTALFLVVEDGADPPMMEILGLKASEAAQILDPDLGVTAAQTDESHLRGLVDRYLAKPRKKKASAS